MSEVPLVALWGGGLFLKSEVPLYGLFTGLGVCIVYFVVPTPAGCVQHRAGCIQHRSGREWIACKVHPQVWLTLVRVVSTPT